MFTWNDQYLNPAVRSPEAIPRSAGNAIERIARGRPPRIERRRVSRGVYRMQAWLQPADATGALRSPIIFVRDVDEYGLGFLAHHDVSALGLPVLFLPAANGRPLRLNCRIARCREFELGWFEGMVQFTQPQPVLAVRRA
jgi:hypothetical protein